MFPILVFLILFWSSSGEVHPDENPVISNKKSRKNHVEIDPINNARWEKVKEAMLHGWNSYVKYA
jgi:mannosyl-oligosaccharide alpha-1,2-mannosidase